MRRILLALRAEMLVYMQLTEEETHFCRRCLLPLPEGDYDSYDFCPWCGNSLSGYDPCFCQSCGLYCESCKYDVYSFVKNVRAAIQLPSSAELPAFIDKLLL